VNLIEEIYETYFDLPRPSGNAITYSTSEVPQGWERIQYTSGFIPNPGDIFITNGPNFSYGHIGIIVSADDKKYNSFETNGAASTDQKDCANGTKSLQKYTRDYNKLGELWGVIRPKYASPINSNVEIIIGSNDEADNIRTITLDADGIQSLNVNNVQNKIQGIWLDSHQKYPSNNDGYDYFTILDAGINNKGKAFLKLKFPKVNAHKPYNFKIKILGDDGQTKTYFGGNQVSYAEIHDFSSNDIIAGAWYRPYISDGLKYGLFKGSYDDVEQNYIFRPNDKITRAEFAKIVVSAAVNLDIFPIDVSGTPFSDVSTDKWYFPYIQTLKNEEAFTENPNRPEEKMTAGEMSKVICKVFGLTIDDINVNTQNGVARKNSHIVIGSYSNDSKIQNSMRILYSIVDWKREMLIDAQHNNKFSCYEPIANGLFPVTSSHILKQQVEITGVNDVSRAIMAKVLVNVHQFYKNHKIEQSNNVPMLRTMTSTNTSADNITIIGDKFESTGNVTGSSMGTYSLGNITLQRGSEPYVFDKFQDITGDIFFYWSVNGGTLEDLAPNNAHNKVCFIAPDNITSTQTYDLYMYAGTSNGRCIEAFSKITVEVAGSPNITDLDAPTGLSVGSIGQNYFKVNWDNADWDNVTKYVVQSATNSAFTQNVQEDVKTGGDANRVVGRDPGTYYIRIKAVNTALNLESAWSDTLVYNFDPDIPLDIRDEFLSAGVSGNSVTLNWYSAGGRDPKYSLYLSDWHPFGQTPILENTTAKNHTINNLSYNTTYYWGVKVFDSQGNEDHTNVKEFTTAKSTAIPTGSLTINNGAATTNTSLVNLQLSAQVSGGKIEKMKLSNDGVNWTDWLWYSTHYVWKLHEYGGTINPGQKAVYVKFKDNSENESAVYTDNITLEQGVAGYFIVRDKQFISLREAIEYAQAGDNIYVSAGYFDLTDEMAGGTMCDVSPPVFAGAFLKDGVNLIGEGAGKTTLYWDYYNEPFGSTTYSYYGIIPEGNNIIEGLTIITPQIEASSTTAQSNGTCISTCASNITIKNCELKNSSSCLLVRSLNNSTPTHITLQNCLIHDNGIRTIFVPTRCNDLKIYNNSIYNNGGSAVVISSGSNISVKNNIVAGNGGQAIYINKDDITNLSFTNNNVWGNHYSNQAEMNYDNQPFSLLDQTGINGNISVDPGFDNNHKLLSNSPCINTGINVGLPYAESAPDMGAFETGLSAGSLTINSNITANFVISKPDGSSATVSNGQTVSNLVQGIYGVYPQQVAEYNLPNPQIITLTQGSNTLQVNYTADTQAPEGRIYLNAGDFFTHSRYISIYNDITDKVYGLGGGAKMQFSNNGTTWSPQEPLANKKLLWDLAAYGGNLNEGAKVIYAKFCDAGGNWSGIITDTIQYIPNGRIIVADPNNTYTDRTDGDVFLLKNAKYYFYKLGGSSVSQKIKIQGLDKNAGINAGTYYEPVKFDNVTITGNMNSYGSKGTFTNVIINDGDFYLTLQNDLLLANSILTGQENPNSYVVHINSFDAKLNCYNNVIAGKGNQALSSSFIGGIRVNANQNNKTTQIRNNIIMDFMSDSYSGAIVVQRNGITYGDVEISNNNFHNNKIDVNSVQLLVENHQPYYFAPDFLSDGSFRLQPNSPLRHLGSDNIIHHNHDGSKNTLGIEGGLFYNTVPTAQAVIISKNGQVTLDASGSFDEQTPTEYLQYRWDYNNDGIFDTEFLLTPEHTVSSAELSGDTIVGWVFDEHFSMNYVKVAKTNIKILPDDVSLTLLINGYNFCSGSTVNCQPSIAGQFDNDNLFTVELSDANGDFSSATTLDYIYGNVIDATQLSITLPGDLQQGNYKMRLSSTNPPVNGTPTNAFSVNSSLKPEITINADNQDICEGSTVNFTTDIQNAGNNKTFQWFVNEQPVSNNAAYFSSNALENGDVIRVEMTCNGGCFFPAVVSSNEISITVKSKQTPFVGIYLPYIENLQTGESIKFYTYAENSGENITYEWSINGIGTSGNGSSLTAIYSPDMTVSVKALCSDECLTINIVEDSYTFIQENDIIPVTSVNLDKTAVTLFVGDAEQLTATVLPVNATSAGVTWSSNDPSVATVNSSGLVTGVAAGTATITVATNEGNFTATCAVTVNFTSSLNVSPPSLNFAATGGSQTLTVASNVAWTAVSSETWATVSVSSGSGNGTVTVTASANSGATSRTATITVSGGGLTRTVSVAQAETPAQTLNVSPSSLNFAATGGSQTLTVASSVAWTAVSSETWATVSVASGSGNGTVTVWASANSGSTSRTATITFTGGGMTRTVNVTQDEKPAVPSLTIAPSSLNFPAEGDVKTFAISSNGSWTIGNLSTWTIIRTTYGSGNSTIIVTALNNTGAARTANITIRSGDITQTLVITQEAAQQVVVDPTPPADGRGSLSIALEIPTSEQFRLSFTVTLPAGFLLDEQATSLVAGLQSIYRLSITPNGNGSWLFEIVPGTSLRSGNAMTYREIVNVVYTIAETVADGNYEVNIRDVDLTVNNAIIHQDEIRVPVTVTGSTGNAPVEAVDVRYYRGILSVNTPSAERITVYSISGIAVCQAGKDSGAAAFNLKQLSRGIYIVRGSSGWTRKILRD
jgi:uncharacterized protein YjdB